MLKQKLQRQRQYIARRQEDIATYVGRNQKLIVLEAPIDNVPDGYTQVTMSYKNEKHTFLIPQKAKLFMANPGENGKPLDALDELADFYEECGDFEHELMIGGSFNTPQVNVSTLARNSYQTWTINQLVRQKGGSEMPIWDEKELERLGVKDSYVDTRLKGIAATMLGKNAAQLKSAGLEDILEHSTLTVRDEIVSVQDGYKIVQVYCDCGSHFEYRAKQIPVYRDEHTIEKVDYTALPQIERMETEIKEHRQKKGMEQTRHDQALLRTYLNLKYIAKEDPSKQLDVVSKAMEE